MAMADRSSIEWTEATWNPTTGCDRVSSGCDNCYALTLAKRLKAMGSPKYQNDGDPRTSGPGFAVTVHEDALTIPFRWKEPRLVFVNSMSDLSGGVESGSALLVPPFSLFRAMVIPGCRARQLSRTWNSGRGVSACAASGKAVEKEPRRSGSDLHAESRLVGVRCAGMRAAGMAHAPKARQHVTSVASVEVAGYLQAIDGLSAAALI